MPAREFILPHCRAAQAGGQAISALALPQARKIQIVCLTHRYITQDYINKTI